MRRYICNKIFLAFAIFASVSTLKAQTPLVLSSSNESNLQPGVFLLRFVNTATLTAPSIGMNNNWDFSKIKGGQINPYSLVSAKSFSNTAVADTSATITIGGGLDIPVSKVYDMDASGFFEAGAIINKQVYSLYGTTGGLKDSLTVPAQVLKYRQDYIHFPCSFDTVWGSQYRQVVNFVIDAKGYFLNKASASKVSHVSVLDSVVGWGTLNIPSPNKSSIPYPVLLVRERTITTDSFYLLGSPAPTLLLSKFGVAQGISSTSYSEYFYRAGTPEPLLTIGYDTDYTYTNPNTASFTADNVESGIESESVSIQNLSIYPNPASSGNFQCSFYKTSNTIWKLSVVNELGQTVYSNSVSGTGKIVRQIDLNNILANGLYYLNLADENNMNIATSKLDIRR